MASSNRHWPSMFKSKPCNTTTSHHHHWQQQHDINSSLISNACHRTPYTPPTGPGGEERTPEPKPRWNPRPEQIRILETIFNSGMVNPPRDEIRKIRAELQEFGQVGDANVFYWFQNRKSRSKHKQRQLQNNNTTNKPSPPPPQTTAPPPVMITAASSSSSSSDKTSTNNSTEKTLSANMIELLNSPTGSVNQPFFSEFLTEPFFFPVQKNVSGGSTSQGFYFPEVPGSVCDVQSVVDNCPSFLLSELMLMSHDGLKKAQDDDEDEKMKLQQQLSYGVTDVPNNTSAHSMFSASLQAPSPTNFIFPGEMGPTKSTVFINDVCFEVGIAPFNVRETFGDDAMLIQSSGQPVMTNEWGVTLQPLQHGGVYYLVRAFTPTPHDDRATIHLI